MCKHMTLMSCQEERSYVLLSQDIVLGEDWFCSDLIEGE